MSFASSKQIGVALVVAVAAWLSLEACTDLACEAGCDEEESDCLESPDAYALGQCAHATGAKPNKCEQQFCENLRDQCRRDCEATETELSR